MIELCPEEEQKTQFGACMKVLGVGGAGGNAVNSMIATADMETVEFIVANTDAQSIDKSSAPKKIQLGAKITKGLGAGSNPDVGRRAAEEDLEPLLEHIDSSDILFLTAGLGGGTGSGGLPVIANVAREMGILTVAIVTKPFIFEGKKRMRIANEAVEVLKETVDTLIVVPNQRLLEIADAKISMLDAFALSNDILKQAIKGISDIITRSGHINVDFADVRSIMKDMGMAIMGTGRASGQDRAKKAALAAITSPLLENVSIEGAKGVLINITGNTDLGLYEINEAASTVYDLVSEDANIILGSVIDEELQDEIMVTVIATGFETQTEVTAIKGATVSRTEETPVSIKTELTSEQTPVQEMTQELAQENTQEEKPAQKIEEKKEKEEALSLESEKKETIYDLDDLDTPTFMRKKKELQKKYKQENDEKNFHHKKHEHKQQSNESKNFHEKKHEHKSQNYDFKHKRNHEKKHHNYKHHHKQNQEQDKNKENKQKFEKQDSQINSW